MDVRTIQTILNNHGFPCGGPDGVVGPATTAAVSHFQAAYMGPNGVLDIDGVPGDNTQAALDWVNQTNSLVTFFSLDEVRCHHCGLAYVKRELLAGMFHLREALGPIRVASAYRCPAHNAALHAASNSMHVLGLGFDPENVSMAQVLPLKLFTGVGTPDHLRATHLDLRVGNPGNPTIFYDASNK